MLGHALARLLCVLIGHTRHQQFRVGPRGVSWECSRCHTLTPSRALVRVK